MYLTVITATYNRAYVLPNLYRSLLRQETNDFEWLVIDDGSTDETAQLIAGWSSHSLFPIRYFKTENRGKPRAINQAIEWANTPYLFIIDSDDYLMDDVLPFFISQLENLTRTPDLAGLGVMRGNNPHQPIGSPSFGGKNFIDGTNLERNEYGLNFDCNELYKVDILKKFPFKVWEGELFSPEEIVLNEMALQGYKVRWFNKVGVISEYLNDGLTVNAFDLIKKNPMGYAMLFNHNLKHKTTFKEKFENAYLMVCYSVLGRNIGYLSESNAKLLTVLAFPVGLLVALRRKRQFENH